MSPIEQRLYAALIDGVPDRFELSDFTHFVGARMMPDGSEIDTDSVGEWEEYGSGDEPIYLWHQVAIDSYRADFVVSINGRGYLAIECDGHDWHERTKQQAAYDRSRDRDLLKRGILTARFTGSEIHHSAERCAADVFALVDLLIRIDNDPLDAWHSGFAQGRVASIGSPEVPASEEHW